MTCQRVPLSDGTAAIVCSGRLKRCGCNRPARLLCDWKVPSRRSGTCDRPLCARCTHAPAPGKDLCPEHARAWAARQAKETAQSKEPVK